VFGVGGKVYEPPPRLRRLVRKLLPGKPLIVLKLTLPESAYEAYKREIWLYNMQSVEYKLSTVLMSFKDKLDKEAAEVSQDEVTTRRFDQLAANYYNQVGNKFVPKPLSEEVGKREAALMTSRMNIKTQRITKMHEVIPTAQIAVQE